LYLRQLQRMGRPVPQWLSAYIVQLKLWWSNRNLNQMLPAQGNMKMRLSR
jgi:hypothetical protein